MRGTVGRTWVTQLCDTLEWPSCAHTWVTQLYAYLRGIKRLHKHNRNKYLGNISITGLKRIKNDTENVSSGLKTWLFQSNLMYFLMWKGEFPPILLGFELALHRHSKTISQGIKWCWWIFQVIYCPWKIALANAVLGDCPVPCQPQLPWHGVTQSLRLVHGCPEQGIPKVSMEILLCMNPQGLFHFNAVSAQGSVSIWEWNAACLETGSPSQCMCLLICHVQTINLWTHCAASVCLRTKW